MATISVKVYLEAKIKLVYNLLSLILFLHIPWTLSPKEIKFLHDGEIGVAS